MRVSSEWEINHKYILGLYVDYAYVDQGPALSPRVLARFNPFGVDERLTRIFRRTRMPAPHRWCDSGHRKMERHEESNPRITEGRFGGESELTGC